MLEKFFDPFSKLAREATDTNINVYINNVASQIPEMINNIQKEVKNEEHTR